VSKELPIIYGFNKTSEAGSDIFAPSIFLGNCNLRCPYCINSKLVKLNVSKTWELNDIKEIIKDSLSDWIIISGGEATFLGIEPLTNLLEELKSWGKKIGMSTNGTFPDVLENVIKCLDYVDLDIKTDDAGIYQLISIDKDIKTLDKILFSYRILSEAKNRGKLDFEVRTTLYPPVVSEDTIVGIGSLLSKNDKWILQQFRHSKSMLDPNCENIPPYTHEDINVLLSIAKKYCDNVQIRYV
jgi:pyruvate formate lyase activating enzyme